MICQRRGFCAPRRKRVCLTRGSCAIPYTKITNKHAKSKSGRRGASYFASLYQWFSIILNPIYCPSLPNYFLTFAPAMISINNLTFEIGARALYDEANWHIKPGDKTGLIGANGTGKTTLLKLIVGEYTPTSGTISMAKELKIGYLNQDLLSYESDKSILHVAMEAFERQNQLHNEIEVLLKKLETDYSPELIDNLSNKQSEFEALDGYNIEFKAHEILAGLGFSEQQQTRRLSEFSGGWRMRVMLARILLQAPDILLLDEPTNHLDLPSIKWLESYLLSFEGAIVIVSHD